MNFIMKRPKSRSSLAELKRKSAENLKKLEEKGGNRKGQPTDQCRLPDRPRCKEIFTAIEAGKRVSRPAVLRAVGSELEAELGWRLEANDHDRALEEDAVRAFRAYRKLRSQNNLMRGRLKSVRLSPSNMKKLETLHSKAMEALEFAIHANPELERCISVTVKELHSTDPEEWPYRVYPSQGPQEIMGQVLRMVIEGKSTV